MQLLCSFHEGVLGRSTKVTGCRCLYFAGDRRTFGNNPQSRFSEGRSSGCLLECPVSGDETTRKIAGGLGQQEFAIYDVLRRAQSEGSFDSSVDARRSHVFS